MSAEASEGLPSFDARARDNATLRPAVGAVARITEEARIIVGPDGFFTQMTDSENVAMVRMRLPAANFDTYEADDGTMGLNVSDLWDALRDVGKTDPVRLEGDVVEGVVRVHDVGAGRVVAELDMLDPDEVRVSPDLPSLDWQTDVEVPADEFGRVIRASNDVGSHITMGVAAKGRTTVAGAGFAFQTHTKGDRDEVIGFPDFEFGDRGPPAEATAGLYSLDKVNSLRLAVDRPASTSIKLTFAGETFPFTMEFTAGDSPGAEVFYMLAPRVGDGSSPVDDLEQWAVDAHALDQLDFVADMKGGKAKQLFNLFATFADEYRMQVGAEGMEMRAVDPANVALYAVQAHPRFFDSYEAIEGWPDDLLGLGARVIDAVLKKWRQNDDLELAADSQTRFISLKHPVFTVRIATINPESIRAEPTLPPLDLPARARADAERFVETAEAIVAASDVTGFLMSDARFYLGALREDDPFARRVEADTVEGRALSVFSSEFIEKAIDVIPQGPADVVEVRAGLEHPVAIDAEADDGLLQSLFLVAPRIQETTELQERMAAAVADEPLDLSWLETGDVGEAEFAAVQGFQLEALSERARIDRLTTFPIESQVILSSTTSDLSVAEADEMAVPAETIDAVIADVDGRVLTSVLDGGEAVADVTFTSETDYDVELRNVQPSFEFRLDTADGVRMERLIAEADNWAYISDRHTTPAEGQVIARAADVAEGDEYAIYLGFRPAFEEDPEDDERIFRRGFDTIGNAYAELVDYITENDVATLVADAGGEVSLSDFDVQDALDELIDPLVNWSFSGKPGHSSRDAPFYAGLIGRMNVLPDASFRADITIPKPGEEADGYLVRWHVDKIGHGPGDARPVTTIAEGEAGVADDREGIAHLVQRALDSIGDLGDIYVRERGDPTLDRGEGAGPGVRRGEVGPWTDFYLPESEGAIRQAIEDAGLPVSLTDVDGVGPGRASSLREVGIHDMLDLVALLGTTKNTFVQEALLDLPDEPRINLYNAAEAVWEQVIWPRRPAFPGEDGAPAQPEAEPAESFETAALRVPNGEVVIEGVDGPEGVGQDVFGDEITVDRFAFGLGYVTAGDTVVMSVREDIADAVEAAIGPASRFSEGQVVGTVVVPDTVLSAREPVQIRVKEHLLEAPVTVISPFRPLTGGARDALKPFGILNERSIREASRQTEVDVRERPPDDVLEEHELIVDEDPIEVWESDTGQRVEIFETAVIAEGVETSLSPEEAADQVREEDRFSPVDIDEDTPFGPVEPAEVEEAEPEEPTIEEPDAVAEIDDFPYTLPVSVEGEEGRQQIRFEAAIPVVALEQYPDEKASDSPMEDFTRAVASTVAEAIGPPLERVPSGTVVGEITVFQGGSFGFKPPDDIPTEEEAEPEEEPDAVEAFVEEAVEEPEEPVIPPEQREFNERLIDEFGLDKRPFQSILFQDLPGIGRSTQEAIEAATGLSAVWNARAAFEMRDERDEWDDLLGALPNDDARRTLVEAIGEDPDDVLVPPEPPEPDEDDRGERHRIVVQRIAGDLNYTVEGTVPGNVVTHAISAAIDEFGPASAFSLDDVIGTVTHIGGTVTDVDLDPGRALLAGDEEEEPPAPPPEFTVGQLETIIEQATEGLDAQAIVFDDTVTRVELDPDFDSDAIDPGASSRTINVDEMDPDFRRVIDLALQAWDDMRADIPDALKAEINQRRRVLEDQFDLDLPMFDVEDMVPMRAGAIEDIVTRSIAGAEVTVRINVPANSLQVSIEPVEEGRVMYGRQPEAVFGQPDRPQDAIIEALQEWEDAVDLRTVQLDPLNDRREAVSLEHDIRVPPVGEIGAPGEDVPERTQLLEKWLMVKEGLGIQEIDESQLIEQPGLELPVEVEQEVAGMIEGATRAEFEVDDITQEGELGQEVLARRAMEGVKQVEQGLQIHHTDGIHDEVHAVIARALDAEPDSFYDSSDPSDLPGYDRVYTFTLSRQSEDQAWTVPRFTPSELFEQLKRWDSDRIKIVTLAAPLR